MADRPQLTTTAGNRNSISAGPERTVHAKGWGAFGERGDADAKCDVRAF